MGGEGMKDLRYFRRKQTKDGSFYVLSFASFWQRKIREGRKGRKEGERRDRKSVV